MYEKYFGFDDLPFRVTPQPQFFYSNSIYREALATLRYGIEARKGFIVITGEVGTGKTTLLKIFMRSAESVVHTAFVFNPKVEFTGLLRFILKDLAITPSANDKYALLEQLNDYLIQKFQDGQIVALLLDEAQQLSDGVLEELRLLSNLETENEKLIQIVLMGQPELEQRLNRSELRQLKQRITLHCRLAPLKSFEIRHYIDLRLKTVGYDGNELFETKAIERITFYTRGIPRLINVICDNALLIAYGACKRTVSAEIIEEVAFDLELTAPPQPEKPATNFNIPQSRAALELDKRPAPLHSDRRLAGLAIAFLLILLLAGGSALYFHATKGYLAHIATEARDFVDMHAAHSKHAELTPHVVKEDGFRDNSTAVSETKPQDRFPVKKEGRGSRTSEVQGLEAARTNEPAEPRLPKSSATQVTSSPIKDPTIHIPDRSKPQRSEGPRYWPHDKPTEVGAQKSPRKEQRFFRGHFEVVRNSIAFEKPTRDSALIATLRPGTWVRVEEKVGSYLRVRSLNDPWIRGYVHTEDAFFEYIGFDR
jgi:general secretion pathway protein A